MVIFITMENPPFLMGKSTISMAIFNSYVKLPEGILKETFLGNMFANILF